ncbi:MAG: hypothetical protein M3163_02810 [Actinomycetota bacterium]|nr:hypothetical protein [Actinomycetota bacterium]
MAARTIGVYPVEALERRRRLFTALERAHGVQFAPRHWGAWRDLDALILFDDGIVGRSAVDTIGLPCYVISLPPEGSLPPDSLPVTFGKGTDRRLRNRVLIEEAAAAGRVRTDGDLSEVLAWLGPHPGWVRERRGSHHLDKVAVAPVELTAGERLKDHLQAGQFFSLLPLVQFLRDVCGPSASVPTPLRATFILDDLNLNWPSYGYLRYSELVVHAARHNYHTAIAMVPIDARFAHPRAVRLFKQGDRLSLVIHGNNHLKWELSRPSTRDDATRLAFQALRRIERFERKYGLTVGRVMVPPHERCSELMMDALLHSGFDAVCYARGVEHEDALIDWHPADLHVAGGLPAIHREPLFVSSDELTLRAFLEKPLILYGHHSDVGPKLDLLEEAAGNVNALGDVSWMSTDDILQSNFSSRIDGNVLWIRPFSRRIKVRPPTGVTHVAIEARASQSLWRVTPAGRPAVPGQHSTTTEPSVPVAINGSGELAIRLNAPRGVTEPSSHLPAWSLWPTVRRRLTEGRDRLRPLLGR